MQHDVDSTELQIYREPKNRDPPSWTYLRIRFFSRPDNTQKFKNFVKYAILPLGLIALFVGTMLISPQTSRGEVKLSPKTTMLKISGVKEYGCLYQEDELQCKQVNISDGPALLLHEIWKLCDGGSFTKLRLRLVNATYRNDRIIKGWLPAMKCPQITDITFEGISLKEIGDQSFANLPALAAVTIINTSILYLSKNAFKGATELKRLSLQNNKELNYVDQGVLSEIAPNLETFQLQGMDLRDPTTVSFFKNLSFSDGNPLSITILDLQDNLIGTFRRSFIENFPAVIQLFLTNSVITTFETAAFESSTNLKTIDLRRNRLETLPQETFKSVLDTGVLMYVEENPINCGCQLQWLQNYISYNNISGDIGTLKCSTPQKFYGKMIKEVVLCEELPTSTQKPVTSTSEVTPEEKICSNKQKRFWTPMLSTGKVSTKFSITETSNILNISIDSPETPLMLAYKSRESLDMACQNLHKNTTNVVIENISQNTDYLFCFYGENDLETGLVSFQDCLAYKTAPIYEDQAWMTHGDKPLTVIYIVCGVVGALLLGGLSAFCVIRKRPTLLRGSERVEIVKSHNGDMVLIMPDKRVHYGSQAGIYETISGYVSSPYSTRAPPPLPPYPATLKRGDIEEHEYLEPRLLQKLPKNADLLLEYEWYTQQRRQDGVLEDRI